VPGELEVYQGGRYVKSVTLANLKKAVLTLGTVADIPLPGDGIPLLAAQLFAKRIDGQPQTFVVTFDADGQVGEERRLSHDDSFYIGQYRLVYKNYAEEELILPKGEFSYA
jgi:hypothetical protein